MGLGAMTLKGYFAWVYSFFECHAHTYTHTHTHTERKQLKAGKGKKKIPCTSYYWRGPRRWHSASGKYNRPSRIPVTKSGTSSRWHRRPCEADKTEYMCFNQRGDIFTLKSGPLKLVDKFTYLGSSVSVIWKSDLTDEIKHSFFPCSGCITTTMRME